MNILLTTELPEKGRFISVWLDDDGELWSDTHRCNEATGYVETFYDDEWIRTEPEALQAPKHEEFFYLVFSE